MADSITFTGLNPERTNGITEISHRYILKDDSLIIWYRPESRVVYFKSDAEDYFTYFLSKEALRFDLPRAENTRPTTTLYVLNVKLGYRDDQLALVVQDEECSFFELDSKVKRFTRDFPDELWGSEITCQLFIDETVSCEYTFRLIDC